MNIYLVTYIDNKNCITSNKVKASTITEAKSLAETHKDCVTILRVVPAED